MYAFKLTPDTRLHLTRKSIGLAVEEVATNVDIKTARVRNHESGHVAMKDWEIIRYCKLYGISPNELLGWED